jgi:hypothetical protein
MTTNDVDHTGSEAPLTRRLAQFNVSEKQVVAGADVATRSRRSYWGLCIALLVFAIAGISYETVQWSRAKARLEDYHLAQAELRRLQVALSEGRPDATPEAATAAREAINRYNREADNDRRFRVVRLLVDAVLLAVACSLALTTLGFTQYHRYRAALQDVISGRLDAQEEADKAAAAKRAQDAAAARAQKEQDTAQALHDLTEAIQTQRQHADEANASLRADIQAAATSVSSVGVTLNTMLAVLNLFVGRSPRRSDADE